MIAGHFGFAAAVKSRERQAPRWALMLACQWLDVIFVPLLIAGIERITPVPGTSGGYGQVIITADYTHSLIGALGLSAIFGLGSGIRWGTRNGVVLGIVAFSHWVVATARSGGVTIKTAHVAASLLLASGLITLTVNVLGY